MVTAVVIAGLLGWFLVDAINSTTSRNADDASRAAVAQTQINGCDNRQVRDGYIRSLTEQIAAGKAGVIARNSGRANLPVQDCEATYAPGNEGRAVKLKPVLGLCFIGLVRKGYFAFGRNGLQAHQPFTNPERLGRTCRAEGTYRAAYRQTQKKNAGVDYDPHAKP